MRIVHCATACSGMRMPGQRKTEMFLFESLGVVDAILVFIGLFPALAWCVAAATMMVVLVLFVIIDSIVHFLIKIKRGGRRE